MDRPGAHLAYKIFSPNAVSGVHSFNTDDNASNYKIYKEHPPVILLHGITNTKDTWDDCAQIISNRTGTKVYSLDARNHGDSEWTDEINYINMAEDVGCFMDSMGMATAILIGHSMGGKTAMSFALRHPHRVNFMIIEDMSIEHPESADIFVRQYIVMLKGVLHKIPPGLDLIEAKKFAARYLSSGGKKKDEELEVWDGRDLPLRLKPGGGYEWKTNLDAIQDCIERDVFTPDNLLEGTDRDPDSTYDGPILLIYGTQSPLNVLENKEMFLKRFPNTVYEPVMGAKHSIHIEYAEIFIPSVCDFILKHRYVKPHL